MALVVQKAPSELEDFTVNWATRGLGTDTISGSSWAVVPAGLGIASPPPTFTGAATTVWLSGGVAGQVYTLTNTISTAGGRTCQQELTCFVYQ